MMCLFWTSCFVLVIIYGENCAFVGGGASVYVCVCVCVCVNMYVSLTDCLFVCLSVRPSVRPSVCLVCLPVGLSVARRLL